MINLSDFSDHKSGINMRFILSQKKTTDSYRMKNRQLEELNGRDMQTRY